MNTARQGARVARGGCSGRRCALLAVGALAGLVGLGLCVLAGRIQGSLALHHRRTGAPRLEAFGLLAALQQLALLAPTLLQRLR
jgi:hypothetical protein